MSQKKPLSRSAVARRKNFHETQKRINTLLSQVMQGGDKMVTIVGGVWTYQKIMIQNSEIETYMHHEPTNFIVSATDQSPLVHQSNGTTYYTVNCQFKDHMDITGITEREYQRCTDGLMNSNPSYLMKYQIPVNTTVKITISMPVWNAKILDLDPFHTECEMQYGGPQGVIYDISLNLA